MTPPFQANDYKATLAVIAEVAASNPQLAAAFDDTKFIALCNSGAIDEGLKLGEKLYEANKDDAESLNNNFWEVINPELPTKPDARVVRLALRALGRAVELEGDNPSILDSLAQAQFLSGTPAAALTTEEKAMDLLKKAGEAPEPLVRSLEANIKRFRMAVEAAAKK